MATTTRKAPDVLLRGNHKYPAQGLCLTEAVAWMAGEPHSDQPECCSPVLAAFGRAWNDGMRNNEERAQLLPFVPRLIGTAGDAGAETRRADMALQWMINVQAPAWLELAGLSDHAETLRSMVRIDQSQLAAAGDAARDAARAATWDAAWAAARAAAGDAARAALEPTVRTLQSSAHDLFDQMITCVV